MRLSIFLLITPRLELPFLPENLAFASSVTKGGGRSKSAHVQGHIQTPEKEGLSRLAAQQSHNSFDPSDLEHARTPIHLLSSRPVSAPGTQPAVNQIPDPHDPHPGRCRS